MLYVCGITLIRTRRITVPIDSNANPQICRETPFIADVIKRLEYTFQPAATIPGLNHQAPAERSEKAGYYCDIHHPISLRRRCMHLDECSCIYPASVRRCISMYKAKKTREVCSQQSICSRLRCCCYQGCRGCGEKATSSICIYRERERDEHRSRRLKGVVG